MSFFFFFFFFFLGMHELKERSFFLRGSIHHFEMHNTTLTDAQTNDVISGLLPLINPSAPARTVCSECPPGTSDDDSDPTTSCTECAIGRYSDTSGATSCAGTCTLGSTIPAPGSSTDDDCVVCPAGTFGFSSDGVSLCTPCPVGSSSTVVGASSAATCTACPSGESSGLGSTRCQPSGCTDTWASNYDPVAVVDEGACTYSCSSMFGLSSGGSGVCVIFEADSWVRYASNGTNDNQIAGGLIDNIPAGEEWIIQGRLKPGTTSAQPEYERTTACNSTPQHSHARRCC